MRHALMAVAVPAALAFGAVAAPAQAGSILLGSTNGGIAVVYNCSAQGTACENPGNVSYYRSVNSETNPNGAYFEFSSAPLAAFGGASFRDVFSGQPAGASQFGLDVVVPGLGAGTGTPAVPLTPLVAADNVGGANPPALGGVIDWAINDYKFGAGGATNPANTVFNSLFRGGDGDGDSVELSFSNLVQNGSVFTIDIAGTMTSDNILHWFNPATIDGNFAGAAPLYATGRFLFSGTLSYDTQTDTTPGVDYYMGSIDVFMEVPEPASALVLGAALLGLATTRRRRAG
jgi:hypothetical protein